MTNKLSKEQLEQAETIEKEIRDEHKILNAVNVSDPKESYKKAYLELIKDKPQYRNVTPSLVDSTQDYILGQSCSFLMAKELKDRIKKMRDDLGYGNSNEMERLLIEQVCLNWLRVNLLEKTHAVKTIESHTTESGLYWDKRLNSAQRRYLRACETLAKVRKLLAEAELREQQARNKRSKSTAIANKLLKELSN